MWLGKVANSVDLGGACKKKHVGKAQHIKGTRYDGGDWRVADIWYERAGDDMVRARGLLRAAERCRHCFFTSTELRLVMLGGGGGAPAGVQRRNASCGCRGKRRLTEGPGAGSERGIARVWACASRIALAFLYP